MFLAYFNLMPGVVEERGGGIARLPVLNERPGFKKK